MSQSIFAKIRTFTLGNIHGLLDKAIDMTSINSIRQHIRDLEAARIDMQGSLAEARYDLDKQKSDVVKNRTEDAALVKSIKNLTSGANGEKPANQKAANELAAKLLGLRDRMPAEQKEASAAQALYDSYKKVVEALVAKETDMKNGLAQLETTKATADAQNRAASAIEAAGSVLGNGASIDNLADKIGKDAARAGARLENAMGSIKDPAEDTAQAARAQALLAELTGKAA